MTAGIVGKLGVEFARRSGKLYVKQILEGAAARAGVQPGDIVAAVDGRAVNDLPDLMNRLARLSVGDAIVLSVERGGKTQDLRIVAD